MNFHKSMLIYLLYKWQTQLPKIELIVNKHFIELDLTTILSLILTAAAKQ